MKDLVRNESAHNSCHVCQIYKLAAYLKWLLTIIQIVRLTPLLNLKMKYKIYAKYFWANKIIKRKLIFERERSSKSIQNKSEIKLNLNHNVI